MISKCLSSFESGEKISLLEDILIFYHKKIQNYDCKKLACRRNCSSRPKIEEILEICNNKIIISNKLARCWLLNNFRSLKLKEIKMIIPWLINIGLKNYYVFDEIIVIMYF